MKETTMLKALEKFLPADEAKTIYEDALRQMNKINDERKKYNKKVLEQHFGENILPILALYLVLKENKPEVAFALSEKVANEMYGLGRKRMEFLGRFPFFYGIIKKFTPNVMQKMFPDEGWDIEWVEVSEKQVAFNMHGCFYHNALTEYNAPELTPIFCGLDDLIYDNVSPYLRWERKGTLGRGDQHCDFRFINPKFE